MSMQSCCAHKIFAIISVTKCFWLHIMCFCLCSHPVSAHPVTCVLSYCIHLFCVSTLISLSCYILLFLCLTMKSHHASSFTSKPCSPNALFSSCPIRPYPSAFSRLNLFYSWATCVALEYNTNLEISKWAIARRKTGIAGANNLESM